MYQKKWIQLNNGDLLVWDEITCIFFDYNRLQHFDEQSKLYSYCKSTDGKIHEFLDYPDFFEKNGNVYEVTGNDILKFHQCAIELIQDSKDRIINLFHLSNLIFDKFVEKFQSPTLRHPSYKFNIDIMKKYFNECN